MSTDLAIYRTAFDYSPIASLIVSGEGVILKANRAANTLLGYAAGEILPVPFSSICVSPEAIPANIFKTKTEEVCYDGVLLFNKEGDTKAVNICSVSAKDDAGGDFNFCTLHPSTQLQRTNKQAVSGQNDSIELDEVALVNSTDDLIWSVGLDYTLLVANRAFTEHYFKVWGVMLKPGDDIMNNAFPAEQLAFWRACYKRAEGGSYTQELYYKTSERRKENWMEVSFNPIYNNTEIVGVACYSRDVTRQKLNEQRIKRNEAILTQAQSLAKIGSWEADLTNVGIKWSHETYRIFELSQQEYRGSYEHFLELIYEEDRQKVDEALKGSWSKNEVGLIEYRIKAASGKLKIIEQRWQIVDDINGNPTSVLGTCQDITERRNFEEAVLKSEENYRTLFEASPLPKWIYDLATFTIQNVNPAAIKHYGYSMEEFLNLSLQQLRPVEEVPLLKRVQAATVVREGLINFGMFVHQKKDGSKIKVEVAGSKILYQGMNCMMVVINDVTQRESALNELLDREAKLRQANEIAKLGHWELNLATETLFWSSEVFKIWGIENSTVPNYDQYLDSVHPDERDIVFAAHKGALTGSSDLNIEHRIVLNDGTIKWVHEIAKLRLDDEGKVAFLSGTVQDITPQKVLEISLEESNRRYELVSKATSDAIWDWNLVSDSIFWGEGIQHIFGYEEKIMNGPGDLWKANIHPDDQQRIINSVAEFTSGENRNIVNWEQEYRFRKADGDYAIVLDKGFLVKDAHGRSLRMVGAMQDITKRKESEEEMRRSNERFELLGKAANDAVWEWDSITNIGWANLTHQAMFGLGMNDLVPQRSEWVSRLHKDDRQAVLQSYQHAADTGTAMWFGEYRMRTDNKGWLSIYDRTYMEYDERGNVVRRIGSMMDITKRKQEEQHLKLLESVIINANDAVVITEVAQAGANAANKIIYVNEAFTKMTGYESEEIIGKSPRILQGPDSDDDELSRLNIALAEFKPYETTIVNYKKNGQAFWINFSVSPVANEMGWYTHWIAIERDVTAQKLAEIHLNSLNESLQKHVRALASSNAELEQFAFVASHDLQEPLRMVTGFVSQLEKKYGDQLDERGKKYIAFAVDGAHRMRQIILDLLEYSKVGRAEQTPVQIDLNELVDEIKILFRTQIQQSNAELHIDKLPVVLGHVSPMRQVFQNLIGNALKYSRPFVTPQVFLTVEEKATEWEFAVRDNGIGIEQQYFDKVFVIFQRLHHKNEYSGTGMGLAITKKIIDNLGGRIWISPEETVGTTFYFTLPRTKLISNPSENR